MAKKSIEQFKEILNASILDTSGLSRVPQPKYYKPRKFVLPSAMPSTTESEMAQYMLSGTGKNVLPAVGTRDGAETEEPGLLSKIFDSASGALFGAYDFLGEQAENIKEFVQDPSLSEAIDMGTQLPESLGRGLLRGADSADSIPGVTNIASFLPDSFIEEEAAKKQYGHNILERMGVDNKFAQFGGGFVMDVLADPLTYVPIGGALRTGSKAVKAADQLTQAAATGGKVSNKTPFVKPEKPRIDFGSIFQGGPQTTRSIPKVDIPGPVAPKVDPEFSWGPGDIVTRILNDPDSMNAMRKQKRSDNARRAANIRHGNPPDMLPKATPMSIGEKAAFADNMRSAKLAKQGKVSDKKGNVSLQSVSTVIEDIKNGNIPRFGPQAQPATGRVREAAIDIADDFITKNLVGKSKKLDPINQIKLFEKVSSSAKGFNSVKSMLRSAEDHMIRMGKQPTYWDGTRVRLSDVLEEAGPKNVDKVLQAFRAKDINKIDPAVADIIERALARRAISTSDLAMNVSNYALKAKQDILAKYNPGHAKKLFDTMPQQAADAIKQFGLSDDEAEKVKDLVRNILDVDKIPSEKLMDELGPRLTQAAVDGRLDVKTYNKIIKSIQKTVGETPENLAKSVTGNKAVDTFITAFSTNIGRGEMKKFADSAFAFREANAVNRARWFRNMVKGYNAEELNNAFWVAQNLRDRSTVAPHVAQLADKITDYFETMLGSSRFTELKDFEGTAAIKSRMVMADVNKQLKNIGSKFEFTNKSKVKNNLGAPRDYSEKGVGWLKSWENANPKKIGQDPVAFMYDLDLAIERTVAEYSLIDSFVAHFGATRFDKHFKPNVHNAQLGHHRTEGYYFPKEQQEQMIRLLHDLDENIWKPNSQITRFYGRGLRAWKTGVTIYLPSHHIRNLIGDLHLMWWAGHNDPRNFTRARRVMHAQRGKYKEALKSDTLADLRGLTDADAMSWAATKGEDVVLRRNGVTLNADQLYVGAYQRGLLLDANKLEDIFGDSPLSKIGERGSLLNRIVAKPLDGKAHALASNAAEYREHYVRLSHFIGAVNKNLKKTKDINKAMDDAAAEVRKWHPDGRDLTQFEQKLRYAIPFYSWTRKAFPLVVQAAVQRPAKVLYYPRTSMALQGMLGVEAPDGVLDPFPDDQLFPDWIRERSIGPIGDPESDNFVSSWWGKLGQNSIGIEGQQTGYTVVNPSNPFQDLISETFGMGDAKSVIQGLGNITTPAFKIPAELMMDRNMLGMPISGDEPGGMGYANYAAQQVPIVSPINNVAEFDFSTMRQKEPKPGREGGFDSQAFINYLTALGLRGTGPFQKTAEFEAKARAQK